jgi:hypothetical protein
VGVLACIYRAEIDRTQAQLQKEETQYQRFTKALVWYTIPLLARERNTNMNRAMAHLAAITASSASAAYTASMKYLEDLHLDAAEIVDEANDSTAKLVIPPVGAITMPSAPKAAPQMQTPSGAGSILPPVPPVLGPMPTSVRVQDSILTAVPGPYPSGRNPWDEPENTPNVFGV